MRLYAVSTCAAPVFILAALAARAVCAAEPAGFLYDVPRVDKIAIDGKADDWGDRGFRVDVLSGPGGQIQPPEQFDSAFRLGWDERGLLVLVTVHDSTPYETESDEQLYQRDSVELFMSAGVGSPQHYQLIVAGGNDPRIAQERHRFFDQRQDKPAELKGQISLARTDNKGYILEVLLPWENLGLKPKQGDEVAFQLFVNNATKDVGKFHVIWYPNDESWQDTKAFHRIRLSDKPTPPIRAAAAGDLYRLRRAQARVWTPADLAGKSVEVRDGATVLGTASLAADAGRASARVTFPLPPAGKPYGQLLAFVDGQPVTHLVLPDIEARRADAIASARFLFRPAIFSDVSLPGGEFENPDFFEDAAGPYTAKTTYYDADMRPVTRADKPGRYGAITQITLADGRTLWRFQTLFRTPQRVNWNAATRPVSLDLPKELGIGPAVLQAQSAALAEPFKWMLVGAFRQDSDPAVVLAGLFETRPGEPTATSRTSVFSRDRQWWAQLRSKVGVPGYQYSVWFPSDYEKKPDQRFALLLHLHGSGERGDDLKKIAGTRAFVAGENGELPLILVAPLCPAREGWSPYLLGNLLDELAGKYRIDLDRVYVSGYSMGGWGTWELGAAFPTRFAAICPCAGGGDAEEASVIKDLPVWAFHGDKDDLVSIDADQKMFAAMQKIGGRMRFTVYVNGTHFIPVPFPQQVIPWLLQQRRGQPAQGPATQPTLITPN